MYRPFRVSNIKDTNSIIQAALNGETNFEIKTDDVNKILDQYKLNTSNKTLVELLENGTYQDWFNAANDNTVEDYLKITKFLKSFIERFEVLRKQNHNLYKESIKIFNQNPDMSDEEAWEFKWPELKYDKDDEQFEIS